MITAIENGEALATFAKMVCAQGGDPDWIMNPELFPKAKYEKTVYADREGYIARVDTEGYGIASLLLGAGRNTKEDEIDYAAGIKLCAKTGDYVKLGEPIAVLYSEREELFGASEAKLLSSTEISAEKPNMRPLILDRVE